jgi:hypothetical protein
MKKSILLTAVLLMALVASSVVVAQPVTGVANLNPSNDSGIQATIVFLDNGSELRVIGTATGLDPNLQYVSLIYDIGSDPTTCVPSIFDPEDPNFIIPTMCIGLWDVRRGGAGSLSETNIIDDETGERVYVPLTKIGTVSVRVGGCAQPHPLRACGEVVPHPE